MTRADPPGVQPELLRTASLDEVYDAALLPPTGRPLLLVLAGYASGQRSPFALAEPRDLDLRVRLSNGRREYEPTELSLRLLPAGTMLTVDPAQAQIRCFDTRCHDSFRVFLLCRNAALAAELEQQLTRVAFEAATAAGDWRLENVLAWCACERRVRAGDLQPRTGIELPAALRWELRRPVFRANASALFYEWELVSSVVGAGADRPVVRCVTDAEGEITRASDLSMLRMLRVGRQTGAAERAAPVEPAIALGAVAPVEAPATPPQPAPVPARRGPAVLDLSREKREQSTVHKVRKLFDLLE